MSTSLKIIISWSAIFLFRLLPFRPPNFEPMMAALMPFSKRLSAPVSFLFGFLGIIFYDAVTSGWGEWTWVTAFAYGFVGIGSHFFFKNHDASIRNFVGFGIVGTLFYDAITGLTIGPVFHGQSFAAALVGQIPFTLMHLFGTVVFAVVLSPALYRWAVADDAQVWTKVLSFDRA